MAVPRDLKRLWVPGGSSSDEEAAAAATAGCSADEDYDADTFIAGAELRAAPAAPEPVGGQPINSGVGFRLLSAMGARPASAIT
jgi:hypothetical protein